MSSSSAKARFMTTGATTHRSWNSYDSVMTPGTRDSGVRLADLVAAFSLATDLGLGQPMDHVLRSWRIAALLGDHVGIEADARADLYYVATLAWVGCVADTPEVAALFGDDIAFRADYYDVDFAGLPLLGFMLRHIGAGSPPLHRLRLGAGLMATGGKAVQRGLMSHCLSTAQLAQRFGLGDDVCVPLQQVFARWDGKGVPSELSGEDIALPMRLFHLADIVEVHHRTRGIDAAVHVARSKRGKHLDPIVVDAFCQRAREVLGDPGTEHDWEALVDVEPSLQQRLTEDQLDGALEAIADFTDLRSTYRAGHSRAVAELAAAAARQCGLPDDEVVAVRRAGLVHDLGLHGIPATVLDKSGPLSAAERERLRMHPYYTDRMLVRPAPLARVGAIASRSFERCDGSGYHRGLDGSAIPTTARLLAAACAYRAMTEARPHRPALARRRSLAAAPARRARDRHASRYAGCARRGRGPLEPGRLRHDGRIVRAGRSGAAVHHRRRRPGPDRDRPRHGRPERG